MKAINDQEGFKALFDNATEGIIVANARGEIVRTNPSAEKLFGYSPNELIGKPVETLIPKKIAHKHTQLREEFVQHPQPRSMGIGLDLFGRKKDDTEIPVEVSLSPLDTEDGKFIIAFIVDNSFRKKQEALLKQANLELEKRVEDRTLMLREAIIELEKNKQEISEALEKEKELNDLKSRFVSMASHEFRTPLGTILSSVSLIAKYNTPDTEDKKQKHIERIKSSVSHLTDILNDLLSLSKLEEGVMHNNPELFNIAEFCRNVVSEMQAIAKEQQTISYAHSGKETTVKLDAKFLKHILINLISNAIKFSPEGKPIRLDTKQENNLLTIIIADEGIGIDEKDQKRLFERFFRGDNVENIPGTGLGLNIVTKYLELMKGQISFESAIHKGTKFTITVPCS